MYKKTIIRWPIKLTGMCEGFSNMLALQKEPQNNFYSLFLPLFLHLYVGVLVKKHSSQHPNERVYPPDKTLVVVFHPILWRVKEMSKSFPSQSPSPVLIRNFSHIRLWLWTYIRCLFFIKFEDCGKIRYTIVVYITLEENYTFLLGV